MMNNMKQREEIRKPPPNYVGGKPKLDCREQSAVVVDDRMVNWENSDCRECSASWRRSRSYQRAAEARQWPGNRGGLEETEGQKNLWDGAGCARFRSGVWM